MASLFRYALLAGACCTTSVWAGTGAELGGVAAAKQPQPTGGDRPAAVLENQGIGWPEIAPLLAEAAGAGVLEEVILERALEEECRGQSVGVGEPELQRERDLLVISLARAAQVPESEGERLVRDVRVSRGLGDRRFAGLIRRNAMMRALVRRAAGPGGIAVPPEDLEQAFQLRYGPKIRARLILVRTQEQAAEAVKRITAGEAFSDVAAAISADPSRLRGGLLDPISPADPGYPVAFRRVLEETTPGSSSGAIMVPWDSQPGFAILRVEERIDGQQADRAAVSKPLEDEVRAVRERAAMDRLARAMIDAQAAKLSVLDDALEWSWRNRRGAADR